MSIENLGKADISKALEQLVQKGESMPRRVAARRQHAVPGRRAGRNAHLSLQVFMRVTV